MSTWCSDSAGVEKTSWWALTEDSLPNICGESAKGLFWLLGDSAFNCVRACVCMHVCVILCVYVSLNISAKFFGKNNCLSVAR